MDLGILIRCQQTIIDICCHRILNIHHHIRCNACFCQTDALGGKVLSDGQRHRRAVRELIGSLEVTLAYGLLTDDYGRIIFPQGCTEKFRCGIAGSIHQHRHGKIQELLVRLVHMLLAVIAHGTEQVTFRQQVIQQLYQFGGISAGIVADVKNQLLGALFQQLLNGFDGFLSTAFVKILDGHQTDVVRQQFIGCHRSLHLFPLDGNRFMGSLPQNRQRYMGSLFALHQIPHIRNG